NNFRPKKSWIRLQYPGTSKLGGGLRVKQLKLSDQWDKMFESSSQSNVFQKFYGQKFDYELVDEKGNLKEGESSGVASFEPMGSMENPLIMPIYPDAGKLIAPIEFNYTNAPIGMSFYPSAGITYSTVTVSSLTTDDVESSTSFKVLESHRTGKVVNKFFTTKDYPTTSDMTHLKSINNSYPGLTNIFDNLLRGIFKLRVKTDNYLSMTQGFSVHTNDMDGKPKSSDIYNEFGAFISGTEQIYSVDEQDSRKLNNKLPIIDSDGSIIRDEVIGEHYDVVADFKENEAVSYTGGINTNGAFIPLVVYVLTIPVPLPSSGVHTNVYRGTTMTKVVHTTGILKEVIARENGAEVSTKNLAWDANTGSVLLTETTNEFDESIYSFNYPAYWNYNNMGLATNNIGIEGELRTNSSYSTKKSFELVGANDASLYLTPGDELLIYEESLRDADQTGLDFTPLSENQRHKKLWVYKVRIENGQNRVYLMDKDGEVLNWCKNDAFYTKIKFKILRSGYRNMQ
ncbi:hypothetical protein, partial [Aureivirga marina]|uniref:hypothetical protein n=1 Tax=Aureivirga marina TaxID=1182451 RepID=UPI0018C96802